MHTLSFAIVALACTLLAACSSDPHTAAPAPSAAAPMTGSIATLQVEGLSCPLCASNVDKQLLKVAGVEQVAVDLGAGVVTVRLDPAAPPSEAVLRKAIEDSGYTLTAIAMP